MTKRESQIANLISTRIRNQDPKAEVILFGSHARGQSDAESDWDMMMDLKQNSFSYKKTNRIDQEYGKLYFGFKEMRQESNYSIYVDFDEKGVRPEDFMYVLMI